MKQIPVNARFHHLLATGGIKAPLGRQATYSFLALPQRNKRLFGGVVPFRGQIQPFKAEGVTRQFNLLTWAQVKAYLLTTAAGEEDPAAKTSTPACASSAGSWRCTALFRLLTIAVTITTNISKPNGKVARLK